MSLNFPILLLAALVPLLVGFVWYNPKTFGNIWMKEAEMTDEKMKSANMAVIFGLTFVLGVLLAIALNFMVVHQLSVYSILVNEPGFGEPGSDIENFIQDFMGKYGQNFRTFKHGAFHGIEAGLLFALPLIAVNGLFERKSWKYILINAGFWTVCLVLMGGIICAWA